VATANPTSVALCVCGWTCQGTATLCDAELGKHKIERGHDRCRVYPMAALLARAKPTDNMIDTLARVAREDLIP